MCTSIKSIKKGFMVPLMILFGTLRFLGFVFALTAMVSNFLDETGVPADLISEQRTQYNMIRVWKWTAVVIETLVCLLVMADTTVTTDGPFGEHMDEYSFLRVIKVPPAITRAVLWLIMLALPSAGVQVFLLLHYNASVTTTVIFMINTARKIIAVPTVIYLVVSLVRHWSKLLDRKDHNVSDSNHWHLKRYYEDKDYNHNAQRPKQKVEKVIIIIACLLPIAGHVLNLLASLSILPDFGNQSRQNVITTNSTTAATRLEISTFPNQLQNILPISINVFKDMLYYLDSAGTACVKIFLSIVLVLYFIMFQCRATFLPIHTVVKIFHFYNFLSALPSNAAIRYIVDSTTGSTTSAGTSLWILAMMPIIFFGQALPYLLTRKVYQLLTEPVAYLKVLLPLFGELAHPNKLYRFFHSLTIITGVCGFIALLLGIPLPWIKIDFQPKVKLSKIFDLHDALQISILDVLSAFNQVVGCVNAPNSSAVFVQLDQLKKDHAHCFDSTPLNDATYCKQLAEGVTNASNAAASLPRDCIPLDECLVYLPVMIAALVLIQIPHCGPTADTMIRIARVFRKLIRLRKKFTKVGGTFQSYYSALKALKIFFKRPIATNIFMFTTETYTLAFLLPCFLVGIACVSIGFWRRNSVPGGMLKLNRAYFLFFIFASNSFAMVFAFLYKTVLKSLIDALPLMTGELTELLGWHFVKAGLICSTIASSFLWIYSIADVIKSWAICECLSKTIRHSNSKIELLSISNEDDATSSASLKESKDKTPSKESNDKPSGKEFKDTTSSKESKDTQSGKEFKDTTSANESKDTTLAKESEDKTLSIESMDKTFSNESKDKPSGKKSIDNTSAKESNDKTSTKESKDESSSKEPKDKAPSVKSTETESKVKTLTSVSKDKAPSSASDEHMPSTSSVQAIDKFSGKITLSRVWLMSLFPVGFAVIVMLISVSTSKVVFNMKPRITGEMGTLLTKVHEYTGWSAYYYESAKSEESLCDVITALVTLPFTAIFSALKSSILRAILDYDEELIKAFIIPTNIVVSNLHHVFNFPVAVAICVFGLGFGVSLIPCISSARKRTWLLRLKSLIWVMICVSFNMAFLSAQYLISAFKQIPMMEVTVTPGPVIHYCSIAIMLLLFAFIELIIGEYGPIKL